MIQNLQGELYQLENKKPKGANFVLKLSRSWRTKNAPKLSSKYLNDRISKIKQLNCILMIIKQNILAILRTFLNLEKKI